MSRKELFKKLNELCLKLSSTYDINNGGCCYVAAVLAEQLELHNISFKIVHYDLYHCHYAIRVSDRYLNRDDYRKNEILEYIEGGSKRLYEIYDRGDWNCRYNRDYNPIIKERIVDLFSKYENNRT